MKPSLVTVVVPAFNESATIRRVIEDLMSVTKSIIVVDDGSGDKTAEVAENAGAIVLRHIINRGLGASLQTGFKKALELRADFVITFDADRQHNAKDILPMLAMLKSGYVDAVIGARDFSKNAPILRKIYNSFADILGYFFFGVYVKDTQSGLRGFRSDILKKFQTLGDRMEISSEIIGELYRLKARVKTIPIESIYTNYSLSKGQSLKTGIKTFLSLILHKFK